MTQAKHPRLRNKESWISEAKREKSFMEYLQGVFEINNGVKNDPATLAALHGPTLFELAQKESAETTSPELEEELVNYFGAMPDDKDKIALARHFAKWGRKQVLTAKPSEELEEEIHRYFKELEKSDCVSNTRRLAKHFAEWGAEHLKSNH